MVSNIEYIRIFPGIIKCVSILLIAVTLALGSVGTLNSGYVKERKSFKPIFEGDEVSIWREIFFLSSVAICLVLSVLNLIIHILSRAIYWDQRTGIYDFVHHSLSFLLLSSSGILNIVSAVRLFEINCTSDNECQQFELKFAAGGMSLVAALICAVIASVVLTNRKYTERDGLMSDEK